MVLVGRFLVERGGRTRRGLRGFEPHVDLLGFADGFDAILQLIVSHVVWDLDERLQLEESRGCERCGLCEVTT